MKKTTSVFCKLFIPVLSALVASSAQADDTEIFLQTSNLPDEQIRPNVLFVLDTSGSMGQPILEDRTVGVGTEGFPFAIEQEENRYDKNTVYPGFANNAGGIGTPDFVYFYSRPNTYADQYIYVNKVHANQMDRGFGFCNNVVEENRVASTTPNFLDFWERRVLFQEPGNPNKVLATPMCASNDEACAYRPADDAGNGGQPVHCNNALIDEPGTDLVIVNYNVHNFLQSYYRYTVLQRVMRDVIDTDYDVNMSIMRFNNNSQGGHIIHESVVANGTPRANQISLKASVDDTFYEGGTPLSEALWEAALYMRGEISEYGEQTVAATPAAAYEAGTTRYNSPIDFECQQSHIVMLTDGAPTGDNDRNNQIRDLTGAPCAGNCLDELAGWIRRNGTDYRDHAPDITGTQTLQVHTIGFGTGADRTLLDNAAQAGGEASDSMYQASTAEQLLDVFRSLISQTIFEKDTFVAPAVAVNSYTGLTHRDELYFALFQPGASPRWTGNLKKYRLVNGVLVDDRNNAAVDTSTGFFSEQALSVWSTATDWDGSGADPTVDGDVIQHGGMAYELAAPNVRERRLFTNHRALRINAGNNTPTPLPLNRNARLLRANNNNITTEMLGLGPNNAANRAEREAILDWARGETAGQAGSNHYISDFIHTRPSVVTYGTTPPNSAAGETSPTFDDTIYVGSNLGFLHAVDADNGEEQFAFIPTALLPNLTAYYRNSGDFRDKVYGLDAPMAIWRNDNDRDGNIEAGDGDRVYIYQGMRRGGTNLYALDVTDRDQPQLMWQIRGQGLEDNPRGNYRDLAQTWSVPQRGKVEWCDGGCRERDVLFFAGGYDPVFDDPNARRPGNSQGNAIYMIDAVTGQLMWSAGPGRYHDLRLGEMNQSIPSDVTLVDTDGDGLIEGLFAIDIVGRLWRFDFEANPANAADFAHAGIIARLGGGGGANFRRFYNAPDVSYFADRGTAPFFNIAVASGYRANPNNINTRDFLYVIRDPNAVDRPVDSSGNTAYGYVGGTSAISPGDLGTNGAPSAFGWRLRLDGRGEKGLTRTVTFNGQILMTTFVPGEGTTCESDIGSGRSYQLDARTGISTRSDGQNYGELTDGGIPPEPAVIFAANDACIANCDDGDTSNDVTEKRTEAIVCIGTECEVPDDKDAFDPLHKTFWREN